MSLFCAQTGVFVPEKSNIWRDCVDGMYDWVQEHIEEVCWRGSAAAAVPQRAALHSLLPWYTSNIARF